MIKIIFQILIVVSLVFGYSSSILAEPNENSSDIAKQNSQVKIPKHANQIAPGIYYLGTVIHEGKVVEGIMAFHHKSWHDGGSPQSSNEKSSCYSLIAKGAKWKNVESWKLNPTNKEGLTSEFLLNNISQNIAKWEQAAGMDILGEGSLSLNVLVADVTSPDGMNEVYFGDIAEPNSVAVTIVWGVFSGPPSLESGDIAGINKLY